MVRKQKKKKNEERERARVIYNNIEENKCQRDYKMITVKIYVSCDVR